MAFPLLNKVRYSVITKIANGGSCENSIFPNSRFARESRKLFFRYEMTGIMAEDSTQFSQPVDPHQPSPIRTVFVFP